MATLPAQPPPTRADHDFVDQVIAGTRVIRERF